MYPCASQYGRCRAVMCYDVKEQNMMDAKERMRRMLEANNAQLLRIDAILDGSDATPSDDGSESMLVTHAEAARRLGVSRSMVYQLAKRGKLKQIDTGGRKRVTLDSIRALAHDRANMADGCRIGVGRMQMGDELRMMRLLTANPVALAKVDSVLDGTGGRDAGADDDCRLVTYTEAAKRLNLSRPTVYRLARAGRLKAVPLGGAMRIRLNSVMDFAHDADAAQGSCDREEREDATP